MSSAISTDHSTAEHLRAVDARRAALRSLYLRYQQWLQPALLAVATAAFFWPATGTFFVGDDFTWIQIARTELGSLSGWITVFTHADHSSTYRPLTQEVFFWVCWNLFGSNPLGYHLVALAVFVVTALTVYFLILQLVSLRWVALCAAAFWAFSMTHFEALAWASAFSETGAVVCVAFSLLAMARSQPRAMLLWYLAALMSNETTMVVPALAAVYFLIWKRERVKDVARHTAALWITFGVYLVLRKTVIGLSTGGPFALVLSPRIWLQLTLQSARSMLGFSPTFTNVAQYSRSPWEQIAALAQWLLILGVVAALVSGIGRAVRRRAVDSTALRLLLTGALWFVIGMSPVLPFARDFADYNLSIALIGYPLLIAGLVTAAGRLLAPALALWLALAFILVNGLGGYGPGGLSQVDGAVVFAHQTYYAYIQMLAYEQRHPGPLHVQVNDTPEVFWAMSGIQGGRYAEANLVFEGSMTCFGDTCAFTPDIQFHWNDATTSFDR
jgi:hypothetical protein